MNTNVHTKTGEISAFGYACGYITRETKLTKETNARLLAKELYKDGNVYHVRQFNDATTVLWEVFNTLNEAKNMYRKIVLS